MNKKLSRQKINYILAQLIIFTFVCLIAFIDFFFQYDFQLIRYSIWSVTMVIVIVYEILVHLMYRKAVRNFTEEEVEQDRNKSFDEKYLWFEIILSFDVIVIISLISLYVKSKTLIIFLLFFGFMLVYLISILIKPYFGIKNKK